MIDINLENPFENNRIKLDNISIQYCNGGMILDGCAVFRVNGNPTNFHFVKIFYNCDIARKLNDFLGYTFIKNGGYGLPRTLNLVFDHDGCVIDIEGEPYKL